MKESLAELFRSSHRTQGGHAQGRGPGVRRDRRDHDGSVHPPRLVRVEEWGPYIESIRCLTLVENRTTNFRVKSVLQATLNFRDWVPSTPADLHAYVSADGSVP